MDGLSPYEMECREIKRICDKYGHGNVMEWASALWRREARAQGFPEDGCFVPTCPKFIKRKYQNPKQHELYDGLVKRILGTRRMQPMRTYLRPDYAIHQCGAGYEYCDGECSHCAAAASTYTTNTSQPRHEPHTKERPVTSTSNEQTRNDEVAFQTVGRTY